MPKIKYIDREFRADSLTIIERANTIIATYMAQGYRLTLRQLYYQFVSRDLLANTVQNYKRLGSIINDARLAGLIDWDSIEDRTRNLASLSHWNNPGDIIEGAAQSYRIDKWASQKNRVEVWIEKEALAGVFERVCQELDVPFLCCRGYTSQSEMWAAAQRLIRYRRTDKKRITILHFGDHDPSGIDMTRDIEDRLRLFGLQFQLGRLALNMDQVEQYSPPPNPAKETDSRFAGYIQLYGDQSWELDALEPQVLADLVRTAITNILDQEAWDEAVQKEQEGVYLLRQASENWEEVRTFIRDNYSNGEEE